MKFTATARRSAVTLEFARTKRHWQESLMGCVGYVLAGQLLSVTIGTGDSQSGANNSRPAIPTVLTMAGSPEKLHGQRRRADHPRQRPGHQHRRVKWVRVPGGASPMRRPATHHGPGPAPSKIGAVRRPARTRAATHQRRTAAQRDTASDRQISFAPLVSLSGSANGRTGHLWAVPKTVVGAGFWHCRRRRVRAP
jgi:hypothetical protein